MKHAIAMAARLKLFGFFGVTIIAVLMLPV
jgi:hypothetical protein